MGLRKWSLSLIVCFFSFFISAEISYGANPKGKTSAVCEDGKYIPNFIPFNYVLGTNYVGLKASWGVLRTYILPFGAHGAPHTGHYEGNGKADWQGAWAFYFNEMTEVPGGNNNGNGRCELGEDCGIHKDELDNRNPDFIAPVDNYVVNGIFLEDTNQQNMYAPNGKPYHWTVQGSICNTYEYDMVHLWKIQDELKEKALQQCGVDLDSVNVASSDNLLMIDDPNDPNNPPQKILCPITLNYGDRIATPQIFGEKVGSSDYYTEVGASEDSPKAHIEWFVRRSGRTMSLYSLLSHQLRNSLESILYAQFKDKNLAKYKRFYEEPSFQEWLWNSEIVLSTVESLSMETFDSIHSGLGGWWEQKSVAGVPVDPNTNKYYLCGAGHSTCDSIFTIYAIQKYSPFYNSLNYIHGESVEYLVTRKVLGQSIEHGEVVRLEETNPRWGGYVVYWRSGAHAGMYQALSYYVDQNSYAKPIVRIRWSENYSFSASVSLPDTPITDGQGNPVACDDFDALNNTRVTCHSHKYNRPNVFE